MSLLKSRFIEMFGDPIKNEKRWAQLTLNSVCDGIGDGLHGTPEYDDSGDFYFINGNNLINGEIVITPSTKKVNEEVFKKYYRNISSNALLLSINGTLGKIAFYNNEAITLGKSACYINLKTFVNKYFVFELMKTDHFLKYLEENSTKSTIKNVSLKTIRNFQLISPPENLQNDFISFSKKIDKSKFLLQQILKKLELLKKSRFIEMFGNVATNNKRWEKTKLGNKSVIGSSKRIFANEYTTEGIPFYRSKEIIELGMGEKPSVELYISKKRYQEIKEKFGIPIPGDILMTAVGTIGKFWIVPNSKPFYYKDGNLVYIRTKEFNPLFLKKLLEMLIEKYKVENANGSAYTALTIEKLKDLQIVLPPMTLQKQYEEFHIQIDKSKLIIQKALEDLVGKV